MNIQLRGVTWEHARGYGSVLAAAKAYREVAPEIEVTWEHRSLQAFADQPLETLARDVDLLVIDHPHVPHAAANGVLAALDGAGHDDELTILAGQSVGLSHASYSYAGHQWGLASDAAAQVSAYRPDLLDRPPSNWNEVVALARTGRVLWPHKPVDAFSSLITVAAGLGEQAMRQPGVFLTLPALEDAMGVLSDLASLVPADNAAANPITVAETLTTSDQYAYSPLLFGYSNYSRRGVGHPRLRFVDIPQSRLGVAGSLLGGAGIAVSASSAHRDAAVAHAFWLASAKVQGGVYYDGGGQPGNAVAWESDRINTDSLDFFRGTRATIEGAYLRPQHVNYMDVQNEASKAVHRALVEGTGIRELARILDESVSRHLEE